MRVVHVVQRFHPELGGTETHVRAVASELARRGHDVTVATSRPPGAAAEETIDGVRVARFRARHWRGDYLFPPWFPMPGLAEFLAAQRADVLHAHGYRFATIEAAASASRRSGARLVVTAHGFYPPENAFVAASRSAYDRLRGRRALAQAARCVAVTRHEVAHYAALGVDPTRVDVVPNGIDEAAFARGDGAAFRERHGLGSGPLVVFLARLAHDKGVRDLVRAARLLPEATFAVCGRDAGELAPARRRAGANVRFTGAVADPRDAYAAADVFALPSHYEAFGIVLVEAMAQGAPVVATTAGGMPEVVGDAGVLVPPRAPATLAEELRLLLADPARRARLADAGRRRARSFLWADVVTRLEETYRRALA